MNKNNKIDKEYLTVEEIAEILGIHWQTVLEYIRSGQLEASKVGKSYRISSKTLLVFLRERTIGISAVTLKERIQDLLVDEYLKDQRGIILSANFLPPRIIKDLFTSDNNNYVELLKNPPTTRQMGWSLKRSQNDPSPVLGQFLEVDGGGLFRTRLYKDGHLLVYGNGGPAYLSHAVNMDNSGNNLSGENINGLAVSEFIYNYSALLLEVIKLTKQNIKTLEIYLYIYNPQEKNLRNVISQSNWNSIPFQYGSAINQKEILLKISLDYSLFNKTNVIAAELWKEYGHVFGLFDNQIAFLNNDMGNFDENVFKQ
jgi:excisionase family DNA binding protein